MSIWIDKTWHGYTSHSELRWEPPLTLSPATQASAAFTTNTTNYLYFTPTKHTENPHTRSPPAAGTPPLTGPRWPHR
jgi:hypothetical protein